MTAYYPTQASTVYPAAQPVVYTGSQAYQPTAYAPSGAYYGQPYGQPVMTGGMMGGMNGGVVYVPSSHGHSHHSHHGHGTQVIAAGAAPVVMQPGAGYYGGGQPYYHVSFGERLRRFFGLAPRGPFKYKHNKGTWGFMGFSRRQRYSDARTGLEVDRKGRPIYRV
ncbi:hypothetical protein Hypma_010279 [Hypsizygus marmoreus]|uniref:Uncharacterized protein n=1 Tax=Hypsizygus marmoreus TaxID=39966 RepID=A0A369JNF3_HYPMA|nr:hypothetical protein Hypma_010279 [Hypsizygus marmoreus]